jgi:DNA mismatch endonuclease (patch repair protein)
MTHKLTRSENMSRIRGKNTKPEIQLRKALWERGFRFRINIDLPGRPDLVFLKSRLAVFVDGCFWHGCPLHYSAPATREEFWQKKLRDNVLRDIAVDDELISLNWKVLRIWQHELKDIETVISEVSELTEIPEKIYFHTVSSPMIVAESAAGYGGTQSWLKCCCGSSDVRVIGVSGHGSLRPNSRNRPEQFEVICRKCRNICDFKIDRQ